MERIHYKERYHLLKALEAQGAEQNAALEDVYAALTELAEMADAREEESA